VVEYAMFPSTRRFFGQSCASSVTFAATVALAYLASFLEGAVHLAHPRWVWCLVLGAIYAFFGAIDYTLFRTSIGLRGRVLYFCVQASLLFAIFWTSRLSGNVAICALPLVGVAVGIFEPAAAAAGVVAIFGLMLAVEYHFYGFGPFVHWAIVWFPAYGFVVIFTRMAVREKSARLRAESLSAEVEKLAVIQERNRLAREIHDGLGHFLTTIHVQLEAARTIHASDPDRALTAVAKAQDLAREALVEVRRSVGALQADQAPAPLPARLRDLASATDGWGAAVSLEILGPARALAPKAEHALFRAAQEGLTNVRKHARAQTAQLALDYRDPARVFVRVTDDGCGPTAGPAGHGLAGLRERIADLGGRLVAENPPTGGFCLQVEIPA
jgi:signal transduction histidine kinase